MPDDILDAAQKAINDASKTGTPAVPAPNLPPEPAPVAPAVPPPPVVEPLDATKQQMVNDLLEHTTVPPAISSSASMVIPPPSHDDKPKKKSAKGLLFAIIATLLLTIPVGVYFISKGGNLADLRGRAKIIDRGEENFPTSTRSPRPTTGPCAGYRCVDCEGITVCNTNVSITCDQYRTLNGNCGSGNPPPFGNNLPGGPCGPGKTCLNTEACDPGTMTCILITGTGNCAANLGNCYVTSDIGVSDSNGQVCSRGGHWTTCSPGYKCSNFDCIPTSGGDESNPTPTTPPNTPQPSPTPIIPASTNTPTPTGIAPVCLNIKIYKGGTQVSPSTLRPGDDVVLAVKGNLTPTKAHFRINGGAWQETTTINASDEFTLNYTIPDGVQDFVIEAEVFTDGAWY